MPFIIFELSIILQGWVKNGFTELRIMRHSFKVIYLYAKKNKTIQAKHVDLNSTEVFDTLNVFTALLSLR